MTVSDYNEAATRVRAILTDAIERLPHVDRQERIAYCRESGQHGITSMPDPHYPDQVLFDWGGRRLCSVKMELIRDASIPLGVSDMLPLPEDIPPDARQLTDPRAA